MEQSSGTSSAALAEPPATSVGRQGQRHRLALVVIAAAQLMVMLDLTIVNIALPSMQRELHFSSTNLTWVINAYVLVFGGLLLLGGRVGDLFGRRRMFALGVTAFAAASLAGGLATDQSWLIAARAVQGIGAAIASPNALALVATTFDEGSERNRAMAVYAGMSAAGGALGLLLGGILVDISSWRWVLFVNVPIGALVLALTPRAIPPASQSSPRRSRLDVPGALGISGGMALLVYGLVRAPTSGWSSAGTVASFVGAALVLAAVIAVEKSARDPLIPLGFLRHRNRAAGYGIMLLLGGAMLSLIYFLTQFLQDVGGYSPVTAGVAYLPIPFSVAVTSVLVSRLVKRHGIRPFLIAGPLLVTAGLLWVSLVNASSTYADVFGPLVTVGVGMGLSFVPLTLNAVSSVRGHQSGLASALLNTSQQVGGSLALATLVTVATSAARDQLRHASSTLRASASLPLSSGQLHELATAATVHGYDMALRTGAVAGALAFLIALLVVRRGPAHKEIGVF
ncbi:MAG: MFS transporter [Actinobacteria bacterium]|nr:MFS transporter [Actinomycetota bacterium]